MRIARVLALACLDLLVVAAAAPGQEKAKKLLVGKWERKSGGVVLSKLEFTKDGKMVVQSGRLKPMELTYKVLDDETIETTAAKRPRATKRKIKVSKDELEIDTSGAGAYEKFTRAKRAQETP